MGAYAEYGRFVITRERDTLTGLAAMVDDSFDRAVDRIRAATGRVCVTGMGKAGIIAQKIAGTLASTGTRAFCLHPAEAAHGDLGMLDKDDVLLVLSNSGESREVVEIIPAVKAIGAAIIAITGQPGSTLAREADVVLAIGRIEEACPLGLAPTSSTTAMLALGDALALTIMKFNPSFDQARYAFFHPGGALGKKLLRVDEVMRTGADCPVMPAGTAVKEVLFAITKARAGGAMITDRDGRVAGFFADGDLRRGMETHADILTRPVDGFMTKNPKVIAAGSFALEALTLMKRHMIGELPVVDADRRPAGMLALKDLIAIGLLA
ncbi:MAG: KpsF/GutQ family sugar-phosphate isomerase [Planctomycetota bacterium]